MTFRIGAVQMNSQGNKEANLATAERLIDEAAAQGADVVALPEMFNIYGTTDEIRNGRESMDGPTSRFLRRKAQQHGITLHGGSIPVQTPDSDKAWNITLVYDPAGELIATYRKIHLFDIDITGTVSDNESSRYEAGTEMVAFESEHGQFGLTICYDIRFPEVYRALTLAGSRVIFQPSAFTLYTGKDHWEALIRARAIENQVYMVSPAADRRPCRQQDLLRQYHDRGSLGHGAGPHAGTRVRGDRRHRLRRPGQDPRRLAQPQASATGCLWGRGSEGLIHEEHEKARRNTKVKNHFFTSWPFVLFRALRGSI